MRHTLYPNTDSGTLEISVDIEPEDYMPVVERKIKQYVKEAQISGFRVGHVPAEIIVKRFGKQLMSDAIYNILNEELSHALETFEGAVWGELMPIEEKMELNYNNPQPICNKYEIALIQPDSAISILLPDAEPFVRYKIIIDEEFIDEVVASYEEKYLKNIPIKEGQWQPKDRLQLKLTELDDSGEPFDEDITEEIEADMHMFKDDTAEVLKAMNVGDSVVWDDFFDHWKEYALEYLDEYLDIPRKDFPQPVKVELLYFQRLSDEINEKGEEYFQGEVSSRADFRDQARIRLEEMYAEITHEELLMNIATVVEDQYIVSTPDNYITKLSEYREKEARKNKQIKKDIDIETIIDFYKKDFIFETISRKYGLVISDKAIKDHIGKAIIRKFPDVLMHNNLGSLLDYLVEAEYQRKRRDELYREARNSMVVEKLGNEVSFIEKDISYKDFEVLHRVPTASDTPPQDTALLEEGLPTEDINSDEPKA